jgi:ATP-dependent DNA helicase DinG
VNKAHVLITNHSLLMSDLALRTQSEGFATILPEYSRLVIDEAHKFENAVTDALSATVNPLTVRELLTRIYDPAADDGYLARLRSITRLLPSGKGDRTSFSRAISKCGDTVASAMQAMEFFFERIVPVAGRLVQPNDAYTAKKSYGGDWLRSGDIVDIRDNELENFTVLLDRLLTELYAFQLRLTSIGENEETIRVRKEIQLYRSQIDQLGKGLETLFDEDNDDVRWIEMPPGRELLSFRSSPLSVDDFLGPFLFEQMKTIIFTSATLAPGNSFEFFNRSVGLDAFETHRQTSAIIDSPFDYDANLMLLVPTDLPDPTSPSFEQSVASIIPRAVEASRGRALILFTSHSMLQSVYEAARGPIEALGYECIAQGTWSRAAALNRFRDSTSSVLFGTASFWDGIDVAGESLSLVVIVRIPFSVPNDPIVAARSAAIAENGKNPFLEFQLPGAAMRLQQGLGRLIRTHRDRGAVLFLDKRLITRQYGRYILDSLPRGIFKKTGIRECISDIERFLK